MKAPRLYRLLLILLLSACSRAETSDIANQAPPPSRALTVQAPITLPVPVQTLQGATTPVAVPFASPEAPWLPTAAQAPILTIAIELPPMGSAELSNLHGLVLFRSNESMPFIFPRPSETDAGNFGALTRLCHNADGYTCLWGLAPDGQSAGMLNPEAFDFNMLLFQGDKPLLVENGFTVNDSAIQSVRLPNICAQNLNSEIEQRCDQLELSSDGRFLAFRYGPDSCGRSMQLIDRQNGEVLLDQTGRVHFISFLPNGKLEIHTGHCEGSMASFYDPLTRHRTEGGGVGTEVWNRDRSLKIVTTKDYYSKDSGIWGYIMETGTTFRPKTDKGGRFDEHPIFLPDNRRFLYEHLDYQAETMDAPARFDAPLQIVRYDPLTDEQIVLVSALDTHYRLCQFDREQPCPLLWYGDWIQIQRVPFTPLEAQIIDWSVDMVLPCAVEGQQCAERPESLALNANTGEIRPWDITILPAPANAKATLTPGPDRLSRPIYADPARQFALYIGIDGKSLWMLPKDGAAVQWVFRGQDFFYLP